MKTLLILFSLFVFITSCQNLSSDLSHNMRLEYRKTCKINECFEKIRNINIALEEYNIIKDKLGELSINYAYEKPIFCLSNNDIKDNLTDKYCQLNKSTFELFEDKNHVLFFINVFYDFINNSYKVILREDTKEKILGSFKGHGKRSSTNRAEDYDYDVLEFENDCVIKSLDFNACFNIISPNSKDTLGLLV